MRGRDQRSHMQALEDRFRTMIGLDGYDPEHALEEAADALARAAVACGWTQRADGSWVRLHVPNRILT